MLKNSELSGVKEIARRANVSIATVDRVLHNRPGVSIKTKEKIDSIIKEMDYKPNLLARQLASKKTFKFAVLIPQASAETAYWSAPLEGIYNALSELNMFGVEVSFFLYDLNDRQTFNHEADNILKGGYQGVIVAPSFIGEAMDFFHRCQEAKIKSVYINSDISNVKPLSYIGPDLFQSGKLAANLCQYLIPENGRVLIVNISKEMDAEHHLMKKTAGFKAYFEEERSHISIDVLTIYKTDFSSVASELQSYLGSHSVDLIFVPNSRVFTVAQYFEEASIPKIRLIGYDYLTQNLTYLEQGVIDFLVCQKPIEQGYQALFTLYEYFVNQNSVESCQFMPIDIITRENYKYYKN